jgi:hypothetical protein
VTATLPRYYVKDFFPVFAADPEPFCPQGQVVYSYCVERGAEPQQVTVSRKARGVVRLQKAAGARLLLHRVHPVPS